LPHSLPASHPDRIAATSKPKELVSSWNKEQLSGSMTRRATALSAVRMEKTYSFTILRLRLKLPQLAGGPGGLVQRSQRAQGLAGRERTGSLISRAESLQEGGRWPPFLLLRGNPPALSFWHSYFGIWQSAFGRSRSEMVGCVPA